MPHSDLWGPAPDYRPPGDAPPRVPEAAGNDQQWHFRRPLQAGGDFLQVLELVGINAAADRVLEYTVERVDDNGNPAGPVDFLVVQRYEGQDKELHFQCGPGSGNQVRLAGIVSVSARVHPDSALNAVAVAILLRDSVAIEPAPPQSESVALDDDGAGGPGTWTPITALGFAPMNRDRFDLSAVGAVDVALFGPDNTVRALWTFTGADLPGRHHPPPLRLMARHPGGGVTPRYVTGTWRRE